MSRTQVHITTIASCCLAPMNLTPNVVPREKKQLRRKTCARRTEFFGGFASRTRFDRAKSASALMLPIVHEEDLHYPQYLQCLQCLQYPR